MIHGDGAAIKWSPMLTETPDHKSVIPMQGSRREILAGMAAVTSVALTQPAFAKSSHSSAGDKTMSTITVKDGTQIFYKEWGVGQPIVFHHGWPLSGDDWDAQMMFFADRGFRVVAHDRRGHGRSSTSAHGNDMEPTLRMSLL